MITESYRSERESIFSPEAFLGERKYICDYAVATFSYQIFNKVLEMYPHKKVACVGSANGERDVYLVEKDKRKFIFYMSSIGSCLAGTDVIEMLWQTGITKLILFGSAGALDSKETSGKYVVPTFAYRDEGMSYHYAKPSDYIEIKKHDVMARYFEKLGLPYVCGKVWTTDAPYRETRSAVAERISDGCIAVEMELAGVQAVCDFYGIELYDFLLTGDILDIDEYDNRELDKANHLIDNFNTAMKILDCIAEEN